MNFNPYWLIRGKDFPEPSSDAGKTCPYFKETYRLPAYGAEGRCLAWTGFFSRFSSAKNIGEYCKTDYQECSLYKAAMGGGVLEYQKDYPGAWPSL